MKTILVVDDDRNILEALSAMLSFSGFEVETCMDEQALTKITKKNLPDIILLDVFLSGNDGRLICRKFKTSNRTKDIPIIMISAHPDIKKSVQEVGADDFIAKPFDMQDLLKKIDHCLSTS